ncbi:MAG: hypothetical protein JOZ25_05770, partial [Actinobacteria bacterium]|nr:hypothetical protein [Actinomycetota bacterium]
MPPVSVARVRSVDPAAYRASLKDGARIERDAATGGFAVVSSPARHPGALVVVVHGHDGSAFSEYSGWFPYAARGGLGIVSVEWQTRWGRDAQFLSPESTYGLIARAARAAGAAPGRILLHGFSQGSHEAFALTSLDRTSRRLFALTLAESGGVRGAT